jgi:hypothetical protein
MSCFSRYPLIMLLVVLLRPAPLLAEEMAVNSQVFNGYAREKLPDGSFKPEFYVFGEGGCWTRPVADPWMDKLTFPMIGHIIAGPLAKQNYRPALKSADAELLIVVFWGSTEGSYSLDRDSFGERDMLEGRNARILGYTDALERAYFAPHMSFAQDTRAELGNSRYYVVLQAYDFKTAVKEKKLKPLWITRLSVGESGDFAPVLEQMVWGAVRYFGQDTGGLKRHEPTLNATVKLGPLEVVEIVPPK